MPSIDSQERILRALRNNPSNNLLSQKRTKLLYLLLWGSTTRVYLAFLSTSRDYIITYCIILSRMDIYRMLLVCVILLEEGRTCIFSSSISRYLFSSSFLADILTNDCRDFLDVPPACAFGTKKLRYSLFNTNERVAGTCLYVPLCCNSLSSFFFFFKRGSVLFVICSRNRILEGKESWTNGLYRLKNAMNALACFFFLFFRYQN